MGGAYMGRIYNFSAGPATLPEAVLKEAAEEMLDYIWKIVIIIGNHVITLMVKPAVNLIKVLNEASFVFITFTVKCGSKVNPVNTTTGELIVAKWDFLIKLILSPPQGIDNGYY